MRRALAAAPAAVEAAPADRRAVPRSLRLPEMMVRTALEKIAVYASTKHGQLPAPKKLGGASNRPDETVQAALDALLLSASTVSSETPRTSGTRCMHPR